jgi:heme/copper-type cytochrome/quinol oxidase subunit 1
LIDRLSQPQRIVIVIALGAACVAVGTYIGELGKSASFGWYAYAPLTSATPGTGLHLHGWLILLIWLALAGLWGLASIRVLRPAADKSAS